MVSYYLWQFCPLSLSFPFLQLLLGLPDALPPIYLSIRDPNNLETLLDIDTLMYTRTFV